MGEIVLFDMDGVLADLERMFLIVWRALYPGRFSVPLDQRTTFYIEGQYPPEFAEDIRAIKNMKGLFRHLPPVPGAIAAVQEIASLGHTVCLCSSPLDSNDGCASEKYMWVEQHLGHAIRKRTILTNDKTLVHGRFLIDDKPLVTGVRTPDWEHVLFDFPYNRHVTGRRRLDWSNWKQVLPELLV